MQTVWLVSGVIVLSLVSHMIGFIRGNIAGYDDGIKAMQDWYKHLEQVKGKGK